MKRPFDTLTETFFENLDRLRENQKYNFSNSEKYMIWIVGFSVGGLAIIVTNITSFNQLFSHCAVKSVLILLTTSIIAGIVYRWAFYMYQIQYQSIEFYLQGAFSAKEMMEIEPDDLSNEPDINEVIRRIKIDFGEDTSYVLEPYYQGDQSVKDYLLKDLINHYKKTGEWSKKDFEFAMEYIKDTFQKAFGLSDKKIEMLFKSNSAKKLKLWGRIVVISFLISCLTFIAVLVLLTVLY